MINLDPKERRTWTLDRICGMRAELTPDRTFLNDAGRKTETFAQTYDRAVSLALALQTLGVSAGDRIVIFAPNSLTVIHVWMAINFLGAVDVPINPRLRGQSLEHAINLSRPKVIVAEDGNLSALREQETSLLVDTIVWFRSETPFNASLRWQKLRPVSLEELTSNTPIGSLPVVEYNEPASIMLTSGTSGAPKGVIISHAQACMAALQVVQGLRLTANDTHYCCQPLFHMSPRYFAIYSALISGGSVWLDRSFQADRWIERIRLSQATVTIGHGPLLEMIFDQPARPNDADNSLTRVAAAPFPKHIADEFELRFGIKGIEAWGMTEINMPCWQPFDLPRRPGSCGQVRGDLYEFRVVDPETDEEVPVGSVGEFVVRPKYPWTTSPGYFEDPTATNQAWRNLWFHTGDGGYIDADGWVYFVDRLKDRIRRRAENISAFDIELATRNFPGLKECAAVGVPSEYAMDDDIKLFAVVENASEADPRALFDHMAKALPRFMVPRFIEFVDSLPRTHTQKLRRAELRKSGHSKATWDLKAAGLRSGAASNQSEPHRDTKGDRS